MGIFFMKRRDTRAVLRVTLLNPDGTGHDGTGSTNWMLHIWLSDGTKLFRTMVVETFNPLVLTYTWVATDWDAVSAGGAVGGLVVGPTLPLAPGQVEHRMEYEVVGTFGARLTFPNAGYDTLRILDDIGQA